MEYLEGIAASSSHTLHPEFGHGDEVSVAAGARDFLASLNQGVGRELLDAYTGNRTDDTRNALAMHYGLCAQVVARQVYRAMMPESRRQIDVGDAEQTAMMLLFQLVEKFDNSLGIPLSAFLTRRLRFALIDEYRRLGLMVRAGRGAAERRRCVSLERGGGMLTLVDPARGPAERMEDRDAQRALVREVPREYRRFVFYRFVRGMQLWQVAKKLNVTYERACVIQEGCLAELRKGAGEKSDATPASTVQRPVRERVVRQPAKRVAGGLLPIDLQQAKEFRRWCVRRVPWAYRKLVAYRYLRGRDIEWTAGRLGICPEKARVLDRQARPMMLRIVQEYRGGAVAAVA